MGALYEDVEIFFGDIFAWYGRRVARRPLPFIIVPFLTCSLLGLGLFNIRYEADLENLYTPVHSRAIQDRQTLTQLFGPYSSPGSFYPHQVVDRPIYAEIIVRAKTADRAATDADRERGENGTKTRLAMDNDTTLVDALSSPIIDEVSLCYLYGHLFQNYSLPERLPYFAGKLSWDVTTVQVKTRQDKTLIKIWQPKAGLAHT